MSGSFFDEAKQQSVVKATIVSKYFFAWAKVIIPHARKVGRIAYIDLFAGPGRYDDGTTSTPLLVLERALEDDDLREMLVAIFNDMDEDHCRSLENAIRSLPGVERLRFSPQVLNHEVGEQVVATFEQMRMVPTLFFIDPWGYKGLSLRLINSVLRNWGCDGIFYFNYNRISMGLPNEAVEEHMDALFGEQRAAKLRPLLVGLSPEERELAIVEALCDALREMGGEYVLPFRFRHPTAGRTSHHLVFVSKHPLGYTIMKDIMASESSTSTQGVPSFEYNPARRRQGLLFDLSRPLDDLRGMLLERFAGRTMTFDQIFDGHHVNTPFVRSNYRDVLAAMEADGVVRVERPPGAHKMRKGKPVFGKKTTVTFLSAGRGREG